MFQPLFYWRSSQRGSYAALRAMPWRGQRRPFLVVSTLPALVGIGLLLSSASTLHCEATTTPELTRRDPATSLEFPETLNLPQTPPLTLLGLGVRTVSFLGIKVYSVGFYADLVNLPPGISKAATFEEKINYIVKNTTCAIRIVPTRSTSHTHLRDGFVRSLQSRMVLARKDGHLSDQEEEAIQPSLTQMKSLFPTTAFPKHRPLHMILTAPTRDNQGKLTRSLVFPELGTVDGATILGRELFLAYFEGKGISPPMKQGVQDSVTTIGQ